VIIPRLLRGPHVLPLAMFFGTFSWSFVYVSLPFHIHRISTWDATSPVLLYVALSLIGLACVPLSAMRAHVPAVPR